MGMGPRVYGSVEGLVQWLERQGGAGKGPWDVAEVGEQGEVRRVLLGCVREGRRLEAWERMEDEEEEESDDEEGEEKGSELW
jgi:hypothetical protein